MKKINKQIFQQPKSDLLKNIFSITFCQLEVIFVVFRKL